MYVDDNHYDQSGSTCKKVHYDSLASPEWLTVSSALWDRFSEYVSENREGASNFLGPGVSVLRILLL